MWEGTFRLVCFVQARLEREQLGDELLPVVGWSWLTESLDDRGAGYLALGGTVTQTSSVRFGDIAGPRRDDDIELRASWTPTGTDLSRHAEAFCGTGGGRRRAAAGGRRAPRQVEADQASHLGFRRPA